MTQWLRTDSNHHLNVISSCTRVLTNQRLIEEDWGHGTVQGLWVQRCPHVMIQLLTKQNQFQLSS